MKENSHQTTAERDSAHYSSFTQVRFDSGHKDDLSDAKCDAELDVDVVPHCVEWSLDLTTDVER